VVLVAEPVVVVSPVVVTVVVLLPDPPEPPVVAVVASVPGPRLPSVGGAEQLVGANTNARTVEAVKPANVARMLICNTPFRREAETRCWVKWRPAGRQVLGRRLRPRFSPGVLWTGRNEAVLPYTQGS
jgi:hypothetical protein